MYFFYQQIFLTQILKLSTPTDLRHPDLNLVQFLSLESQKISSTYAKTSYGIGILVGQAVFKLQNNIVKMLFLDQYLKNRLTYLKFDAIFEFLGQFTIRYIYVTRHNKTGQLSVTKKNVIFLLSERAFY